MSKPISGIASINYNPKRREKREVKSLRITPNQWWCLGSGVFPWVAVSVVCHIETSSFQMERRYKKNRKKEK
jgi:hypothetical protein